MAVKRARSRTRATTPASKRRKTSTTKTSTTRGSKSTASTKSRARSTSKSPKSTTRSTSARSRSTSKSPAPRSRSLSKSPKQSTRSTKSPGQRSRSLSKSPRQRKRPGPASQYQETNSEVKPTKGRSKKQEEAHESEVSKHPKKGDPHYAPTTQASDYVHEEMHHLKQGKHGNIKNPKQAIAIGLSKARKAGIPVGRKQ